MEKKDDVRKAKDAGGKPGVIVAGPQAHAREREGRMPVGRKDEPAKKPAARPQD